MKMHHQNRANEMKMHLQKHCRFHPQKHQQQRLSPPPYRENELFWHQHVNMTNEVMFMYSGTEIKCKWDASSLPDAFPSERCALATQIPNTPQIKTLLQQAIMKADTVGYSFNGQTNRSSRSIGRTGRTGWFQQYSRRRTCASFLVPDEPVGVLLIAGMSSTLTMIREEEDSNDVESNTDDGSEDDKVLPCGVYKVERSKSVAIYKPTENDRHSGGVQTQRTEDDDCCMP
eukprot:11121039-Ditylum_brightwellii.AAC.1